MRKVCQLCVCCIVMVSALLVPAAVLAGADARLQEALDALVEAPEWSNARWGIIVVDLDSSKTLYERDVAKGFMPASNMKLFTTAAALELLGPDHRFETRICRNGPVGRDGTLRGDIVIVGGGDPSISGRYVEDTPTTVILGQWAEAVRKAGIRRVTGSVIGLDDIYPDDPREGTWQLDYYQEWYAAESGGLAINDNCWDATVWPGPQVGSPARLQPWLPTRYVTLRCEVVTTGPVTSGTTTTIEISRPLDGNEVVLSGVIPVDAPPSKQWGSVHDGTRFTATLLREELARRGITVRGGARDADDLPDKLSRTEPTRLVALHTHHSPPLSRLLAIINKPSQNFYADMVARAVGLKAKGRGDFASAEAAVRDFLTTSCGVEAAGFRMADGSGLSRHNLVEPRHIMALLCYMTRSPHFKVFEDSLPIAGVDGTIRSRMRGTPAEKNARAKTGYIGRVRALSGYVTSGDGHRLAFTLMANNFTVPVSRANDTQDSITVLLAKYSESGAQPSLDAPGPKSGE
jgi:D-alanyl-D-alanine carboxypeptidase/D-alanyl-D-alanine-endopeptidase (penicillin-binding protein 4)